MLAVNLADLATLQQGKPGLCMPMLLISPVMRRETIDTNRRKVDGAAVILECDDDRSDAILQVLRMKYTRAQLRIYRRGPRGGWHTI